MRLTRPDGYQLDTDPGRLDVPRLHEWLSTDAYWALGRTLEAVERSVAHSMNYGLYDPDGRQVGFARIVSDRAVFAYLCDVYVEPAARGGGLGTWFVTAVCDHARADGIRRLLLATKDAHGLYAKLGFTPLADPSIWMEIQPA